MDGIAQQGNKLWLLLVPSVPVLSNGVTLSYKSANGDLLLSNGWIYTPIIPGPKDKTSTIRSYDFLPQTIKDNILSAIIIPEFIIPKGFVLPRDLAMLAGHLPIGLSDVELASDREAEFKRRLKQDEANQLNLLSYDYNTGSINHIELKDSTRITKLEKASKKLSLITAIKKFKKDIYLADFNKSTIYKLRIEADAEPEEYLRLTKGAGLKDFAFSLDGTLLYLLTFKDLLIYKVDGLKLFRTIAIGSGAFGLAPFNISANEADYMLLATKSLAEIDLVSTFEHRISSRISIADLELSPDAFAFAAGDLFIIARDRIKDKFTKLVVMDIVSTKLKQYIELDFEPRVISSHAGSIYVAGNSKLVRINPETKQITASLDLGTDLLDPSALVISNTGAFVLIACSAANNIGVVDLATMQLVKKIAIDSKAQQLVVL